jgi:hypothetical protein
MSWTREAWAIEVLRRRCVSVASAGKGERHRAIYIAACDLGPYVASGAVAAGTVLREIEGAAAGVGKAGTEVRRTIDDGLAASEGEPAWWPASAMGVGAGRMDFTWRGKSYVLSRAATRQGEPPAPLQVVADLRSLDLSSIPLHTTAAPAPALCELDVTLYGDLRTTAGLRDPWTWERLVNEVAAPMEERPKDMLPLWAPHLVEGDDRGQRREGSTVRRAVVESVTAMVLDYDDEPLWSVEQCRGWWPCRHVAHTSASHQVAKGEHPPMPRGRVVLALSRPVSPEEHADLAEWVLQSGRGSMGKAEVRTAARAYFVPCDLPGYAWGQHDTGEVLDVDAQLAAIRGCQHTAEAELGEGPDPEVWARLDVVSNEEKGTSHARLHHVNLCTILRWDERWRGRLTYDDFAAEGLIDGRAQTDDDLLYLMEWIGVRYGIHPSRDAVAGAVRLVSREWTSHQVRDYLEGLTWDGTKRVEGLLVKHMAADPSQAWLYGRYSLRWMISAVARILKPGCKVDTMLILKGQQGAMKSSAFAALAGQWFGDSPIKIGTDDAPQALQGVWVQEIPELDSMRKREVTEIKAFLAAQVDRYRVRYDRLWTIRPRQVVMVGTTNEEVFLADTTGSRRYWVADVVGPIDLDQIRRDRDQLWAEAVALYRAGKQWWLAKDEDVQRDERNEGYQQEEPWEAAVLSKAAAIIGTRAQLVARSYEGLGSADVLAAALDVPLSQISMPESSRCGRVLSKAGYLRVRETGGQRRWVLVKP